MMLIRGPGVYRPQADTWLLARAFAEAGVPRGGHALDICTGTGALAILASHLGAASVTAVDISRAAAASAWLNCRARGIRATVRRGDFAAVLAESGQRFDVVLANPPYVPTPASARRDLGACAWNAGVRGRSVLDRLCTATPALLRPRGVALIVQSTLADPDSTLVQLRSAGLKAAIVARTSLPFGPVLTARAGWLSAAGFIEPGLTQEDLVVIRADRTRP